MATNGARVHSLRGSYFEISRNFTSGKFQRLVHNTSFITTFFENEKFRRKEGRADYNLTELRTDTQIRH